MEDRAVSRQPLTVRTPPPRHRPLDAYLSVRLPRLFGALPGPVRRRPPVSRLRRLVMRRAMRVLYEALNRGDVGVLAARCHPDVEIHTARESDALDIEPVYHGRDGLAALTEQWREAWEEFRWEPAELIDLGDRVVVLGRQVGRGRGSGVETSLAHATIVTLQDGRASRLEFLWDWEQAERAVGLRS